MSSNIVVLDVEGVFFKTRISTLTSVRRTFFDRLLEPDLKKILNREGHLFIDRDASIFPIVLNYLRDGESTPLPNDEYLLRRVIQEAKYFNIINLKEICERKLRQNTTVQDASNKLIPPKKPPQVQIAPRNATSQLNLSFKEDVQVPQRKSELEKKAKKLKKVDSISLPKDFTHVAHVGWNGTPVIFDKKSVDNRVVQKIADAATEALDMNAVYNVVSNEKENNGSHPVEVIISGGLMQSKKTLRKQ